MRVLNLRPEIFDAAKHNDLIDLHDCIKNNPNDVNMVNVFGNTPLALAAQKGHIIIVELLLEANADVDKFKQPRGRSPLSWAILKKHDDITEALLKVGASLNVVDSWGCTPLILAIKRKPFEITVLEKLLEKGVDINFCDSRGFTPLANAVEINNGTAIRFLVEAGADLNKFERGGKSPTVVAAAGGNLELVRYLLNKEANFEGSLSAAVKKKNWEVVKLLKEELEAQGILPLCYAALNSTVEAVRYFVSEGADLNATDGDGNTALTLAVKTEKEKIIKYLISCDADVCKFIGNGQSPLCAAVGTKNLSLIKLLLAHGAEHSIQTAFRTAINTGSLEVVRLLKEKGALVNVVYNDNCSPLIRAVEMDNLKIVKFLVEKGANVRYEDGNGKCALGVAAGKSSFQMVKYLIENGADTPSARAELDAFAEWNEDLKLYLREIEDSILEAPTGSGHEEAA